MSLFGNVFHTNCTIFNLLEFLCLEGTERSLCCSLLPLMRVYVLPWLRRGCQSPGQLSWHLCKSWSFSSLCQGATCPNKSSPVPSFSFYQWNCKWMAQRTSKRSSWKASQQNGRDHIWSSAAHHTGCLVRFKRKLAVFSRKEYQSILFVLVPCCTWSFEVHLWSFCHLKLGVDQQCAMW